ncbi:MAG: protease modulator HflC [Spirochaetales bacterium]|nr:protease modulator HflC [Spirochaetales bacterium]
MPKKSTITAIIVLFVLVVVTANTVFIVEEGYQAITIRLGRIVHTYTNAGVNFKAPFVDNVYTFPKKILTWNNKPKDIITNDKEYLQVNVTVRWRITDPVTFYEANRNIQGSYAKLDTILDPAIKSSIAAHDRVEVVRSSNDMLNDGYKTSESKLIETGRDKISEKIKAGVKESFNEMGIEIIEVIFKQVRFSDNLTQSVYERMIKSRKVIAEEYRSTGQGEKQRIIGETDKELLRISSEAKAYEQLKKGEADAQAAAIYADAYKGEAAEFYSFWRALESYKDTLPKFKKTFSTDMEYFQYLYSSK